MNKSGIYGYCLNKLKITILSMMLGSICVNVLCYATEMHADYLRTRFMSCAV